MYCLSPAALRLSKFNVADLRFSHKPVVTLMLSERWMSTFGPMVNAMGLPLRVYLTESEDFKSVIRSSVKFGETRRPIFTCEKANPETSKKKDNNAIFFIILIWFKN